MHKFDEGLENVNVPLEEDYRDSVPSDPLFVTAVIEEAKKDPWTIAVENWFADDGDKARAKYQWSVNA